VLAPAGAIMMTMMSVVVDVMLELVCVTSTATAGVNPGPWSAWWPSGVFMRAAMMAVVMVTRLLPTPCPPAPSLTNGREDAGGVRTREAGRECRSRLYSGGDKDPHTALSALRPQ
jgi:hypothetical protein